MNLTFDFRDNATRASILSQVRGVLDEEQGRELDERVASLGVPERHHANLTAIRETIDCLEVSEAVRDHMRAIYRILTEAEAKVHETTVEQAHFHEVGRAAGIRNVAEICLAIEMADPERIVSTPIQAGRGTIECAHGTMPVPAPATAVILDGGVPTCVERLDGERCTPTSAAVIRHFVDEYVGEGADATYFQGPVPEGSHGHDHVHTHAHTHITEDADREDSFVVTPEQHDKLDKVRGIIRDLGCVAVAFSGGVDSTLLLAVAHEELGERAFAVTETSALNPAREFIFATRFCAERGIRHVVVERDIFAVEGLADNHQDRCYVCKRDLFECLFDVAEYVVAETGLLDDGEEFYIVEGSNATDREDYRPGSRAVREAGVASPLDDADLTKQDIRDLSREMGLPTWNKPSFACLASRIATGQPLTSALLKAVEEAEILLVAEGFEQVRVRVHEGGTLARIEVPADQVEQALHVLLFHGVKESLHELGFAHVSLDVDGYRTGSMNL